MSGKFGTREYLIVAILVLGATAAAFILLSQPAKPPQQEQTPPAPNVTPPQAPPPAPPPQANNPPPPAPPPPAGSGTLTETLGQLLDSGLARADQRFNAKGLEGEFDILTLRWVMTTDTSAFSQNDPSDFDQPVDAIPVKENDLRASSIRFNNRYIDGLRGFAFSDSVPQGDTAPHYLLGTMIFIDSSSPVDGLASSGSEFKIRYDPHPQLSQIMEGCKVLSSEEAVTPSGTKAFIYDFECKLIYGAST